MSRIVTRIPRTGEIPLLQNIWSTVFGNVGIKSFFRHFSDLEFCIIAEIEGSPAAMGYLVDAGDIICNTEVFRCAMIYSVATLPEYRGRGLGTAVVNRLLNLACEHGYSAVALCPSDDELFDYYGARTQFRDWFYVNEQVLTEASFRSDANMGDTTQLMEISTSEYKDLRERLLEGVIYIKQDLNALEYQSVLCRELGGGLFKFGEACATIERQPSGSIWIKELLTPDLKHTDIISDPNISDFILSVIHMFPSHEHILRCPSQSGMWRRFGMLASSGELIDSFTASDFTPWYGLAFD